jgi:hypothetical protein
VSRRGVSATSPAGLGLIAVASVVAVAFVPFWLLRHWDATPESQAFVHTPAFAMWLLVLGAQAAIWIGSLAFLVVTLRRRGRDLRRRGALPMTTIAALGAPIVAILLLAALLNFGPSPGIYKDIRSPSFPTDTGWPLSNHQLKVQPIVGAGIVIGMVAIVGVWLTTVAFADLGRHAAARASVVRRFIALRAELTTLLAVAGVLVGLGTLSTGALREAILAVGDEPVYRDRATRCLEGQLEGAGETAVEVRHSVRTEFEELLQAYPECAQIAFEREYVLAYGLLFSALLAIAFAPSFIAMRRAGARLRDLSFPLPHPHDSSFFDVVEHRNSFEALLQTSLSATATFKAAAAILTPLVASIVSTYVPS